MEKTLIEYFGKPDSGCWSVEATEESITFRSVWGDGEIIPLEQQREDVYSIQVIGYGAYKILIKALGRPELLTVIEEDGLEQRFLWFLKRESKHTESTDILKAFVEECTKRHIINEVKSGYISFHVGGEEIMRLSGGNKLEVLFGGSLSQFATEIMEDYMKGEVPFYINSDGYICE